MSEEHKDFYCVIGSVVSSNIDRTWKPTQEEAAQHAENLLKRKYHDRSSTRVTRLYVVKVVEVVEIAGPPVTRRSLVQSDVEES